MKQVIGITGGIATGKSVVTHFLREKGYEVIDADEVVRDLQQIGGALYLRIREWFGEGYFLADGKLNRTKLGQLIFSDLQARTQLSKIQDKLIRAELLRRRDASTSSLVFMDIPLLFEQNYTEFDEVWLIYAPRELQIKRLMERNALSQMAAILRLDAQMSIDEKCILATRVIKNCGTIEALESQLVQLLRKI